MRLDDINLDFDIEGMANDLKNIIFDIMKIIIDMVSGLPAWVKITMAALLILTAIGIGILTWKYRHEWMYVRY